MTVNELLEQAKRLSVQERKELLKGLIDSLDEPQVGIDSSTSSPVTEHWGQNLLRLLDEMGSVEMIYPEIEDAVEWVKRVRQEQHKKRWGEDDIDG